MVVSPVPLFFLLILRFGWAVRSPDKSCEERVKEFDWCGETDSPYRVYSKNECEADSRGFFYCEYLHHKDAKDHVEMLKYDSDMEQKETEPECEDTGKGISIRHYAKPDNSTDYYTKCTGNLEKKWVCGDQAVRLPWNLAPKKDGRKYVCTFHYKQENGGSISLQFAMFERLKKYTKVKCPRIWNRLLKIECEYNSKKGTEYNCNREAAEDLARKWEGYNCPRERIPPARPRKKVEKKDHDSLSRHLPVILITVTVIIFFALFPIKNYLLKRLEKKAKVAEVDPDRVKAAKDRVQAFKDEQDARAEYHEKRFKAEKDKKVLLEHLNEEIQQVERELEALDTAEGKNNVEEAFLRETLWMLKESKKLKETDSAAAFVKAVNEKWLL